MRVAIDERAHGRGSHHASPEGQHPALRIYRGRTYAIAAFRAEMGNRKSAAIPESRAGKSAAHGLRI